MMEDYQWHEKQTECDRRRSSERLSHFHQIGEALEERLLSLDRAIFELEFQKGLYVLPNRLSNMAESVSQGAVEKPALLRLHRYAVETQSCLSKLVQKCQAVEKELLSVSGLCLGMYYTQKQDQLPVAKTGMTSQKTEAPSELSIQDGVISQE